MMKRERGMTLLEVMLVLVVAAALMVTGMRLYNGLRIDTDYNIIKYNVNTLFQAAARYYQANCASGRLLGSPVITSPKRIDIATDFLAGGYMPSTLISNPLVDSTGPGQGYVVQYNQFTQPRMQQTATGSVQIGTIVMWQIQVSVQMNTVDPARVALSQQYLQGQCTSFSDPASASGASGPLASAATTVTVAECGTPPPASARIPPPMNYIVFKRMPSYATSNRSSQSTYWLSMPLLKQFTQMYSSYPLIYLMSTPHTPEIQYYYCGG